MESYYYWLSFQKQPIQAQLILLGADWLYSQTVDIGFYNGAVSNVPTNVY